MAYPGATEQVDARDSTFLFGSVGDGAARLSINGEPVPVWPNGGWLAWVHLPPDSVTSYLLEASTAADTVRLEYAVRRVARFVPPASGPWIDTLSFSPRRRAWWPRGEFLPLSLRASEGAEVSLVLPDGQRVRMVPDPQPEDVPAGIRAFDRDTANLLLPRTAGRFLAAIRGVSMGTPLGPILGGPGPVPAGDALPAPAPLTVEAVLGGDTVRAPWPLSVGLLDSFPQAVEFNDDTAHLGASDSLTVGRARPGGTYHWFFPTGTRTVATGRLGDDLRIGLSATSEAWVNAADALPLPAGRAEPRATVLSLTTTPEPGYVSVRIPLTSRAPFRIEERPAGLTLRLYRAVSDINWTRYGPADEYLKEIRWLQAGADEVTIDFDLGGPVWGYRARFSRNDLVLDLRRPPRIDRRHPLRGRRIVVDPGHPPAGARGPTGLREAEANLAVALALRELLRADGAEVLMTRETDRPVDLWPRVRFADSVDADLLVSIHNNALPDGVNPFTNSGASVFYYHPRSLPLARAIQANLVHRLGVRDLGAARGDLALVRPTWYPAVLTEGLFMMRPEEEAALRSPAGQQAYALAVHDGVVQFLEGVAERRGPGVP